MKIVILGASGYLGTLLVNSLNKTYKIIGVSRKHSDLSQIENNPNLTIIREDSSNWAQVISIEKPDVVIAANWSGVKKSERQNRNIQLSNLTLLKDIASVVADSKISTFITFGSQAEFYPSADKIPELHSKEAPNEYGRTKSKLLSELQEIFSGSETRFIWARVFSVYGPHAKSDSIVNGAIDAIQGQQEFIVQNPEAWWSFLFEEDFCSAIQSIIEEDTLNGIVNVGSSLLIKLGSFAKLELNSSSYLDLDGVSLKPGYYPNTEKLNSIGWNPRTSIANGFQITLKARKQHSEENFHE